MLALPSRWQREVVQDAEWRDNERAEARMGAAANAVAIVNAETAR
jgi:hypothetical protein